MARKAMKETLGKGEFAKGSLLDGVVRTTPQAEGMSRVLAELGRNVDAVLVFDVDDDELVQRLGSRTVCEQCQTPYTGRQAGERCENCGGTLMWRGAVLRRCGAGDPQMPQVPIDGVPAIHDTNRARRGGHRDARGAGPQHVVRRCLAGHVSGRRARPGNLTSSRDVHGATVRSPRRLVVDLAATAPSWALPAWGEAAILSAAPPHWDEPPRALRACAFRPCGPAM